MPMPARTAWACSARWRLSAVWRNLWDDSADLATHAREFLRTELEGARR